MSKPKKIPLMLSVMTPFPHSIEKTASLLEAKEMMLEYNIHHLPVTEDGSLVSVITSRDIKQGEALPESLTLTVADVVEDEVYIVDLNARLDYVLFEMGEKRLGAAVVLRGDKLVGIFTVTDACRTFGEFLQSMFPDGDDNLVA